MLADPAMINILAKIVSTAQDTDPDSLFNFLALTLEGDEKVLFGMTRWLEKHEQDLLIFFSDLGIYLEGAKDYSYDQPNHTLSQLKNRLMLTQPVFKPSGFPQVFTGTKNHDGNLKVNKPIDQNQYPRFLHTQNGKLVFKNGMILGAEGDSLAIPVFHHSSSIPQIKRDSYGRALYSQLQDSYFYDYVEIQKSPINSLLDAIQTLVKNRSHHRLFRVGAYLLSSLEGKELVFQIRDIIYEILDYPRMVQLADEIEKSLKINSTELSSLIFLIQEIAKLNEALKGSENVTDPNVDVFEDFYPYLLMLIQRGFIGDLIYYASKNDQSNVNFDDLIYLDEGLHKMLGYADSLDVNYFDQHNGRHQIGFKTPITYVNNRLPVGQISNYQRIVHLISSCNGVEFDPGKMFGSMNFTFALQDLSSQYMDALAENIVGIDYASRKATGLPENPNAKDLTKFTCTNNPKYFGVIDLNARDLEGKYLYAHNGTSLIAGFVSKATLALRPLTKILGKKRCNPADITNSDIENPIRLTKILVEMITLLHKHGPGPAPMQGPSFLPYDHKTIIGTPAETELKTKGYFRDGRYGLPFSGAGLNQLDPYLYKGFEKTNLGLAMYQFLIDYRKVTEGRNSELENFLKWLFKEEEFSQLTSTCSAPANWAKQKARSPIFRLMTTFKKVKRLLKRDTNIWNDYQNSSILDTFLKITQKEELLHQGLFRSLPSLLKSMVADNQLLLPVYRIKLLKTMRDENTSRLQNFLNSPVITSGTLLTMAKTYSNTPDIHQNLDQFILRILSPNNRGRALRLLSSLVQLTLSGQEVNCLSRFMGTILKRKEGLGSLVIQLVINGNKVNQNDKKGTLLKLNKRIFKETKIGESPIKAFSGFVNDISRRPGSSFKDPLFADEYKKALTSVRNFLLDRQVGLKRLLTIVQNRRPK